MHNRYLFWSLEKATDIRVLIGSYFFNFIILFMYIFIIFTLGILNMLKLLQVLKITIISSSL